ncbi:MAG: hypothetical protein LBF74_03700, partial [Treponema sp.]|nr:hypothetical protein [Treponema sp.]
MADIYEPGENELEEQVRKARPAVRFDPAQAQQDYIQRQAERQANLDRYKIELSNEEYDRLNTLYPVLFPDEQSEEEHQHNQYRLGTAMKLSRMYNIPIDGAYTNLDAILEATFTKELPPPTAWRAVSDAFAIAQNNERLNGMGMELRSLPKGSEERNTLWKEIRKLREENLSLKDPLQRHFIFEGAKTLAESSIFSLKGSIIGGLGSVIHPVAGIIAGAATAALSTVGLEFLDLLEGGVDEDVAWRTAMVSSGLQGVFEGLSPDIPFFRNSGVGQQLFKMLHNSGKFGAFAKAVGAAIINTAAEGPTEFIQEGVSQIGEDRAKTATEEKVREIIARGKTPAEDEALDKAASDLATAAYDAYLKIAETNPEALLPRDTPEEKSAARWESLKGAIVSTFITGVPIVIRDTAVNIGELRQINTVMKTTPDIETANRILEKAGNKTYENFTAETRQELHTIAVQERQQSEAEAAEEYRRTRLYSGEDRSEGPAYRDQDGRLYTENIRHTESNGVTTGTYQGGNPNKSEENTYWKITYEMEGDRAVIDQVRIAGNYENLKPEIFQGFANDLNQDVTWEGTTYTPQEGAVRAVHIGWDNNLRPQKTPKKAAAAAGPAAEGLAPLSGAERQFFDRLKKAMPKQTDLEARAVLEQFRMGADLQGLPFEEYLNTNFQEGVFSETDANTLAAGPEAGGRKKGAAQFDPETGKALISGSTWADFSTASHEFAHALRRQLTGEYLAEAERVFGVENGAWTKENEEAFSQAYEKYLETGKAPTATLEELFRKFKEFMGRIYRLVRNEGILTADRQAFFDRLFRDAEANREGR